MLDHIVPSAKGVRTVVDSATAKTIPGIVGTIGVLIQFQGAAGFYRLDGSAAVVDDNDFVAAENALLFFRLPVGQSISVIGAGTTCTYQYVDSAK